MIKTCGRCKKQFKIITEEKKFLDKMSLPDPVNCPNCRHELRMEQRNDRQFYKYPCAKCGQEMVTTVNPKKGYTVYCLKCYADFRANVDLTKV
ncbi:hypothetical protein GYA19_02515 [Candidatus Beckwithbacteria bacterium]|nr:hypothetical protein [Candidatus Beckwithbacteria bacterium]